MKQRSTFAITTLILKAVANHSVTRTRLMQELVLNYDRTVKYTSLLVKKGLLNFNDQDKTYSITSKGLEFLRLSEELASFIPQINSMIAKYGNIYSVYEHEIGLCESVLEGTPKQESPHMYR